MTFRLPIRPVLDCMPIQAAARRSHERWPPPLPQRGLIGRRAERFGRIRSVAFKGNPENVPPAMLSESWTAALASRGLSWWCDVPRRTDGSDQEWHDFTSVDAVVCMRNPLKRRDLARKPATRLINSWCAGSIPLADREPGYEELASDGRECSSSTARARALPSSTGFATIRGSSNESGPELLLGHGSSPPSSYSSVGRPRL